MHILSEHLCVKYYSVHEILSNTTNQLYKLLNKFTAKIDQGRFNN
jgi:hypothetical protein